MMSKYKTKFQLFFLLLLCVSCQLENPQRGSRTEVLPFYNEASYTPLWLAPNSTEVEQLHTIPAFALTNQDGETVTEQTFQDKIYITDFFFASCRGICPRMTQNMLLVQEAFKKDKEVMLLSHSVTPERDSIPVLKEYAENYGVLSNKWHLVTGDRSEIYDLGRKSYFVEEDLGLEKSEDEFLHTENFVLIDKNKHIRGIYNGLNKTSIEQLIADVKTLKKEQ